MKDKPLFFETPATFRTWLKKNHNQAAELHVGFFKKSSGKPSITWPGSVAEALCFGWIDGIRRTFDEFSYVIRFTPRRKSSKWSAVNIRLVAELEAAGRMTDVGRAVFDARLDPESKGYSASKKVGTLDRARLKMFQKNKAAWAFFASQPPGYQRAAAWWVMQAKLEATRDRRLAQLIDCSKDCKRAF